MTINLNSTQGIPAEGRVGSFAGRITAIRSGVTAKGTPFAGFSLEFVERVPVGDGYLSQPVRVWVSGFGAAADLIRAEAQVGGDVEVTGLLTAREWAGADGKPRSGLGLTLAQARFR